MVKKLISLILTALLVLPQLTLNVTTVFATSVKYTDFYVSETGDDNNDGISPYTAFKTLERAKLEVKKHNLNMTDDITVHILPGYYQIDKKLVFDASSGGSNGYDVIYQGEGTDDNPSLISGGTKITGWKKANIEGLNIWKAPANVEDTRTLYINGYPAQRARSKYLYTMDANTAKNYLDDEDEYPTEGFTRVSDGFKIPAGNFFWDFSRPGELELVWPLEWTHQRTPVKNIFLEKNTNYIVFDMDDPYWMWANKKEHPGTNQMDLVSGASNIINQDKKFYIENALELLDEPGEFYFDKVNKEIYYYPYEEENLLAAETYVGTTELMVSVEGTQGNKVSNIIFDNIEFRYGAWNEASEKGVIITQTDHIVNGLRNPVAQGGISLPAQFTVNFAKDIQIKNCKFMSLGSSAIKMENGVSGSLIRGNIICDVSGTGIMIDSFEHREDSNGNLPAGQERCNNIDVLSNVVHRAATEFMGMPGISMYLPSNTTISHNDIKRLPYSGIVAGWGWGSYNSTGATGNVISHNKIEDVMNICVDGGHIYTLDTVPGLEISDNYLKGTVDWRGGIYLDSGSEGYTIENNVVEDSQQWFFARELDGNGQINKIVAKNNFYDEFSTATIDTRRTNGVRHVTASNNTKVKRLDNDMTKEVLWDETALDIIDKAGLEYRFQGLLEGLEMPSWRRDSLNTHPKATYKDDDVLWVSAGNYIRYSVGANFSKNPSGIWESKYVPIPNINESEWLEYKVTVDKEMEYNFQFFAKISDSGTSASRSVYVSIDGNDYLQKTVTGSHYNTYDIGSVGVLSKGEHIVRIRFPDKYNVTLVKFRLYNEAYFDDVVYQDGFKLAYPDISVILQDGFGSTITDREIGDGTYKLMVDFSDYFGDEALSENGTYIRWISTKIKEPFVAAAIYDGSTLKSVSASKDMDSNNRIIINDIEFKKGNVLKVFVFDGFNLKPLTETVIYN